MFWLIAYSIGMVISSIILGYDAAKHETIDRLEVLVFMGLLWFITMPAYIGVRIGGGRD